MSDPLTAFIQIPKPGSHRVEYEGSTLTVSLTLPNRRKGTAFLRTNLGRIQDHRNETIAFYETGRNPLGRDWSDIPMRQVSPTRYEIVLPLNEVGRFEFKSYFQCADSDSTVIWTEGDNAVVKIEPAATYAGNSIYNAFVRQFGKNISKRNNRPDLEQAEKLLNYEDYTVIPPSGTFRDLKSRLDFIINKLGFSIIQLLPVHPTPTTYAKMGQYGSPFAPLNFFSVDSGLANFDRSHTPMEQFLELVDEIHAHAAMIFLDLPADHTGWASTIQTQHPDWFRHNGDGSFESPGAWGTIWEDLVKLDFDKRELWNYLAEVFLHWCRMGVDGFRCDAGYMIPTDAWTYIIAKVRSQFEDTVFFLEGLGGGIDATDKLLTAAGMNWAYSELFQNYSHDQIASYLDHAIHFSSNCGTLVHFAETHDNNRLAQTSKRWAKMRTTMAALFAPVGCFGIANGVEWFATEKIDVHGNSSLNWGAEDNMVELLSKLNRLLDNHPAFCGSAKLHIPMGAGGNAVGLLRFAANPEDTVLAVANPDEHQPATYEWNFQEFDPGSRGALDLLSGQIIPCRRTQCSISIRLEPAQVLCLALKAPIQPPQNALNQTQWQLLRSAALRFYTTVNGYGDLGDTDVQELAEILYGNPIRFIKHVQGEDTYLPIVEWYPQRDEYKTTPVPNKHMLLVYSDKPFRAGIVVNGVFCQRLLSCPCSNGRWSVLFSPIQGIKQDTIAELHINILDGTHIKRTHASLLLLGENTMQTAINYHIENRQLSGKHCALNVTSHGGYSLVQAQWGSINSKYDALLAANLHPEMPIDRRVLIPACQVFVKHQGFIQKVSIDCQTDFAILPDNSMRWYFTVPTGMGRNIYLAIITKLDRITGNLDITVCQRRPPVDDANALADSSPISIAIRPYLENRCNHQVTKAGNGAEAVFAAAIKAQKNHFSFNLGNDNFLNMISDTAEFVQAIEWQYCVQYPTEASRGLESSGDLFSPGYFRVELNRGESCLIAARITLAHDKTPKKSLPSRADSAECDCLKLPLEAALKRALADFVADRNSFKTVIAGYPWFLDWGRDTLICLRGMLAAGFSEECADIIALFASYEENGTIPNMICGNDISNRDTSDAPLWLIIGAKAYMESSNDDSFLKRDCRGRSLQDILCSIVDHYMAGTPNGIRMDEQSGLVYSPAHFTWMDTNYPACTPREGYPIEIQAIWIASLQFLGAATGNKKYETLAKKAKLSLVSLYMSGKFTGFSDCLHCQGFHPAKEAVADDHCRPNQLFVITLGILNDLELCRHILQACQGLVVPGAIRTLADLPVRYALPLSKDGHMLNDPIRPYWGHYEGDEDTRRKPAYHNGTAWPWLLPSYCEALYITYGDAAKSAAKAWLATVAAPLEGGCLGHIPEIIDGNAPHLHRGCVAQAWSAAEAYRVFSLLKD